MSVPMPMPSPDHGPVCSSGDVAIRLLREDDADLSLIAGWLSDDRVLEWYGGRDHPIDLAAAYAEYAPSVQLAEGVCPGIALLRGEPVGYVQWYLVGDEPEYGLDDDDLTDTWALDLFIGRPELWGTGVGSRVARLIVHHLFTDRGARRVVIDPRVANHRAIAAYEKCGFRTVRVLPRHELHEGVRDDALLMELLAAPG